MTIISYRKLTSYRYRLVEPYSIVVAIKPDQPLAIEDYVLLSKDGLLRIGRHYAWDGPSGPTIDTRNFMRGSLVHDALYQLIRAGELDKTHRAYADRILYYICREEGMNPIRATYVWLAVRAFGWLAIRPEGERRDTIYTA